MSITIKKVFIITIVLATLSVFAIHESWCESVIPHYESGKLYNSNGVSTSLAINKETNLDIIDILVAFDRSATEWLYKENKGTPEEYATHAVEKLNTCLKNSLIFEFSFRLVGVVTIDEDVSNNTLLKTLSTKLVNYSGSFVGTGEWQKIKTLREELGADIVSLMVARGSSGVVGRSYDLSFSSSITSFRDFAPYAYSTVSIQAADNSCLHMHEIAHTMGCGHPDISCTSIDANIELGPQLYNISSGYYFWSNGVGYHTIMGYNFGGLMPDGSYNSNTRFIEAPLFSSPDLQFAGVPCGTRYNDNRMTLLKTYKYVAQFRPTKVTEEPDSQKDLPALPFSAKASIYNGYLKDANNNICGTLQIKAAKGKLNKSIWTAKIATTIQMAGTTKKIQFKNGICNSNGVLSQTSNNSNTLNLSFNDSSVSGSYNGLTIVGMLNIFNSKIAKDVSTAKNITATTKNKIINISLNDGYYNLSIQSKGKVKIIEYINGKKKSATIPMIVENDKIILPVVTKNNDNPFIVSFSHTFSQLTATISETNHTIGTPATIAPTSYLTTEDGVITLTNAAKQLNLTFNETKFPNNIAIKNVNNKWVTDNPEVKKANKLKFSISKKQGTFTGSFRLPLITVNGKQKNITVNLYGCIIDNVAYGYAILKKTGSLWHITIK